LEPDAAVAGASVFGGDESIEIVCATANGISRRARTTQDSGPLDGVEPKPFSRKRRMPLTRRNVVELLVVAYLTGLAGWVVYSTSGQSNPYASLFHAPRLQDPTEAAVMQQAFADIVARRNVEIPFEKQQEIARLFHNLDVWRNMWFLGIPIQKNPCDLWMMQQIIYETKPDVIVETGTFRGGSALYFAHVLDGLGLERSRVVTIDIEDVNADAARYPVWQKHVRFLHGSSIDPLIVDEVRRLTANRRVLVVLDSVHEKEHVLQELSAYAPLVSPNGYLVVEDTNSDGVPVFPGSIGPTAAVLEFLATPLGQDFEQDASREAMVLTFNPGGWLKRKGA
jgi:cephalosporin hydroxylase